MKPGHYGYRDHVKFGWSGQTHRSGPADQFEYQVSACERKPESFKEECLRAARLIQEDAGDQVIHLFLSGGLDAEFVARIFLEAKIPFVGVFMQYNRGLWEEHYHVSTFCRYYDVELKIINFDETEFLSREVFEIAEEYSVNEPFAAFDIKRLSLIDGYCVVGTGDLVLEWDDQTNQIGSLEIGAMSLPQVYLNKHQRKSCYQFYQYTPELMLAFLNDPVVATWVSLAPKMGFSDIRYFKYHLYKQLWSNVDVRNKFYGYERFADLYYKVEKTLKSLYGYKTERILVPYPDLLNQLDPQGTLRRFDPISIGVEG